MDYLNAAKAAAPAYIVLTAAALYFGFIGPGHATPDFLAGSVKPAKKS